LEKRASFHTKLEKKGIRALGIAESFQTNGSSNRSLLTGVVMRSDMIVDGFVFGSTMINGDDSTAQIISLYQNLRRNDINLVMIGGSVISLYNIIDIAEVGSSIGLPVISVTFEKSEGLDEPIKRHFPTGWENKIKAYEKIGDRHEVKLWTGYSAYVRFHGIQLDETKKTLDKFLKQGAVPEPIRLAQLLARARLRSANS